MSFPALDLWYLCIPVVLFALAYWYQGVKRPQGADTIASALLFLVGASPLFVTAVMYVGSNVYLDHLEPSVGAISYAAFFGHQPLYHGNDFSQLYQLPYGPGVFLANALPYALFPADIWVTKVAPLLALALASIFTFLGLRRGSNTALALIASLLMLGQLGLYYQVAYWNRPEPFLLLAISVGLFASTLPSRWAAGVMGLALAFTISLKPHLGCAFLLPLWRLWRSGGFRSLASCAIATVLPLAALAALPAFSYKAYWAVMQDTAHHPFDLRLIKQNLSLGVALLFLAAARQALTWVEQRPPVARLWRDNAFLELGIFALSIAPVLAIALKAGAGQNHLLPYLPLALLLLLSPAHSQPTQQAGEAALAPVWQQRGKVAGLVAAAMISALSGSAIQLQMQTSIKDMDTPQTLLVQQLKTLIAHYPGQHLEMGYGNLQSYGFASARPLLYFAGSPLELDGAALMDITMYADAPTDHLIDALAQCRPQVWVMPKIDPAQYFTLPNFYELQGFKPKIPAMFSDGFKRAFFANYQPDFATEHYVAYRCRHMR